MNIKKYIRYGFDKIIRKRTINMVANISQLAPTSLLEGRCALVTGGASGIGYAIAKAMINAGASVVVTGRNEDKLIVAVEGLKKKLHPSQIVVYEVMNNCDVPMMHNHWDSILTKLGGVDILVNNAGTSALDDNWGHAVEDSFDKVIDTNLKGTYFFSEIVARYMINNKVHGNILNIASASSLRPADSAYMLSKWGLRGLTVGMAKKLIPYGIVVNGIAPGPTATPLLKKTEIDNISMPNNPLGRCALPDEIANMAVFLTSNMGRTIVGDIVYMTGGAGIITYDDVKYSF